MNRQARSDDSTPRKKLAAIAIFLTVLQIVLLLVLLVLMPKVKGQMYEPVAGIRPLRLLYGPGVGDEPFFNSPMACAFGKDGRVYVADTGNNRVVVFDANSRYLFQFGGLGIGKPAEGASPSWKPGLLNYPTDIAVDKDGSLYVADFRNDQIQVFDADGKFLRVFPDRTKKVGRGSSGQDGHGIAVTSVCVTDDRVFATDRFQILEFEKNGALIRQFGKPGVGEDDLSHPNGLAVDLKSNLIVSDSNHNRILAFRKNRKLLWSTGDRPSNRSVEMEIPRGITALSDGRLIAADAMGSQLILVMPNGDLVQTFGERGTSAGQLNFPVDVDSRDGRLVVAEKGNNRVQIVELVEE